MTSFGIIQSQVTHNNIVFLAFYKLNFVLHNICTGMYVHMCVLHMYVLHMYIHVHYKKITPKVLFVYKKRLVENRFKCFALRKARRKTK